MVQCPGCGYQNAEDAVKCINCGCELSNDEMPPHRQNPHPDIKIMKQPRKHKHTIKILYLSLFTVLIIILLIVLRNISGPGKKTGTIFISDIRAERTNSGTVLPNSGGTIPTAVPSITPTPLAGMESPSFCKMELALLHNKADVFGIGGMVLLDRYSQPEKTCYFTIRDKNMISEIGYISTVHNSRDDFGVQVGIGNKTGNEQSEHLLYWGTVSLAALDKKLSYDQAEFVIQQALANGTAVYDIYDIAVKNDPLELSRVISIFRHIGDGTAR